MVAGTEGSVDESTECMGAGYVVGDAEALLMTLSLRWAVHWLLFVLKPPVYFSCGMWLVSMGETYDC